MSMTRQEFVDDVTTWWELIDFCNDEGCDYCEDIVDEDAYNEYIDDSLYDKVRNGHEGWQDIYEWLEGFPTGYEFYDRYNDCGVDYDFDSYKNDVLNWGDECGIWEEDEEEEEEFDEDLEEDEEELEEIDYNEFFDDDFESTQGSYVRITVEVSQPEPQKPAEPEPEPEPEFGSIDELLKPAF